jgi:F0F1-type ATP synthase membrane subunit b/b'
MRRDEPQIALLAIFAVAIGMLVYFAVKAFGDMVHLSWGAAEIAP